MKKNILKILAASTLSVFSFGSDSCCPSQCNQGHELNEHEMIGAYNAPARIDVKCDNDFYLYGEFLWWQPKQNGLNIALFNSENNKINTIEIDFDWAPAFKICAGYNSNFDDWTINLEYLRLNKSDSRKKTAGINQSLTPLWYLLSEGETLPSTSTSNGYWKLDHNIFNLDLSRSFYIGKKFTLAPYFGIKAGWIDQTMKTKYIKSVDSIEVNGTFSSDSWLIGPRAGTEANYLLGFGCKMIGNISTSLFYQRFDVDIKQTQVDGLIQSSNKEGYINPNLELLLGFSYGYYFANDRFHAEIYFGYEFTIFWDQNVIRSYKDTISSKIEGSFENLMTQGFDIGLKFDF